jgi:plasmid stabilization system protein ParE
MNHRLVVEPEAEFEIDEASRWYKEKDVDLGKDFLRAVEESFAAIQENPLLYRVVHRKAHRVGLRRFPYGLIYVVSEDEVIVLACIHGRRDPKRWQDRVP